MSDELTPKPTASSPVANFLKAIGLVVVAIVLLRVFFSLIGWLFGIIVTVVIVVVVGALIYRVVGAIRKR